jgi:cyclopropane fatty-acyl-phospholipid synthase-like methyltransferase
VRLSQSCLLRTWGTTQAKSLRLQSLPVPASIGLQRESDAIMQAGTAALPEFDIVRYQTVAAPMCRAQRMFTVLRFGSCIAHFQCFAAGNRFALRGGITLSKNQYDLARERIEQAGLTDRVEIRLQDYRDISGTFDRITSVGMFEHVGLNNLPRYFTKIASLLTDDGIVMNHGITSTDPNSGETAYGGGEFIDKYVFPQGELPHIGLVLKTMQEGGLEALDIENLRRHYARTCSIWIDNFESRADQIKMLTDDRHYRIWRVYLAGCAHAFTHDWISLYQVVCTKAGKDASTHPWSRRYMYAADRNPKSV